MIALAALIAAAAPGATVVSPAPERVAVTLYRDPDRSLFEAMDPDALNGFALVTETRTVAVPAGDATIRFEGVAGGIVPVSAVVDGLPGGTIEKNRDARVISPAALIDGTLGRRVTLTRTDKASGATRVEDAELVAGPERGVVLRTASGVEALGCSGLGEGLDYASVPADLSAKPVLSVVTRSPRAATATITLAYLATGFDWTASYVATVASDGRTLDLFAWLTLANDNREGFADAQTQAIAGRLAREWIDRIWPAAGSLRLQCYPLGTTTSDLRYRAQGGMEDIVVTARRVGGEVLMAAPMMAASAPPPPPPPPPPEDLGDLKLYRVPERVTIAANGQKQVALLARDRVPFERVYRITLDPRAATADIAAEQLLRMRNEREAGLGLALPSGSTALYARRGGVPLLIGLGTIDDTAQGQRVTIAAGRSTQVRAALTADEGGRRRVRLTNANPFAVTVEVRLGAAGSTALSSPSQPIARVDGVQTWRVTLPANGAVELGYALPEER